MITSPASHRTPLFPQCLNWLLANQHLDGSWGLPDRHPLLMNDALLSTLASILALKQWGVGEDQINRGLHFIQSNIASIQDEKQHLPIGFGINFPSLIEYAQNLGINLPIEATILNTMIQKREIELQRGKQRNSEGWREYQAYVSEGMQDSQDWKTIMKYQRKNGSLFNSPATTAAVFQRLKNAECLGYLQSVLEKFGNAVPTIHPLDIYARLCMIDSLERLGINHHFKEEIRSVLDDTYRFWVQGAEDIFLDPTTCAMAFRILRLNGYDVSSDPFYQYSEDKFAESLKGYLKDVGAVIELYRASQAIIHPDESILVRQSLWTKQLLKQESSPYRLYADKLRRYVDQEVKDVLNFPLYANLERLLNRRSMEYYNVEETRISKSSYRSCNLASQEILKLAVEDFNICQSIHIEELKQLSRHCLNWLLANQHLDGSWGLPDRHPLLMNDALLSTLASILALKQWGVGEDQINRGLHFIQSNIASIQDEKQHLPIGFGINFPSLIEYAQNLGINLPIEATILNTMIQKREIELQRGKQSNSEGWRAYRAYVSEGMQDSQDWKTTMKYQRKNGSLFISPATTAAVFQRLKNAECLGYLQSVLENLEMQPLDIYARLCMVDSLERLGINHHFKEEIRSVLDDTYRVMLLKLAIRAQQMSEDLSQLMKDKAMEATLEKLMKTIVEQRDEMIMLRSMNQRMEQLSTDVNEYTIQMLDQPTPESHHTDISTDRYNDAHSNMSTDGIDK
ncbi:ent-kaurene synthase [Vigna unguiculata]|uniref:Ent-kaurene synthase n=1 Tax=Vigna unguiculata TaxID=3917 RepID=A0A4D6M8N3_VIGUN|nr:ent-kaurene synthase [Vigna unguiculata]